MDLSNCRVFIVDDNETNIDILLDYLEDSYQISVAMDGATALEDLKQAPPDLILLDIMMPGMDGYEVCRHIKQDKKLKDIPVIFLTAMSDQDDIIKGLQMGVVDYLTKPVSGDELALRVKTHLELKKSRELIQEQSNRNKDLVHILCHDLLNPIGYVQTILKMSDSKPNILERQKSLISRSIENAVDIIQLVRQIREIEEKKVTLELTPVRLLEAVEESLEILNLNLADKNLTIETDIDEKVTAIVERTSFVNSVLNNIISNAIKFSYPGSTISIAAESEGEMVVLSIQDSGIGIPDKLIDNVFDYTKTTSRPGTENELGTGFGMPLLKKFVTLYGGTVEIRSREEKTNPNNHGTRVKLQLKAT